MSWKKLKILLEPCIAARKYFEPRNEALEDLTDPWNAPQFASKGQEALEQGAAETKDDAAAFYQKEKKAGKSLMNPLHRDEKDGEH